MTDRVLMLAIGFIMDLILGDPQNYWHPVRWIGKLIEWVEHAVWRALRISEDPSRDIARKKIGGIILVVIVAAVVTLIPLVILLLLKSLNEIVYVIAGGVLCYFALAMKSLKVESMKVYDALVDGDIDGARKAVSMIVGRDTENLDEQGIAKAAVETVAENSSDGVVAPLLFMLAFGVPGGYFYKAVNTMDSMVGYKNDHYRHFGTAAAKLDDLCNWIPARITAVAMIFASFWLRLDLSNALRIWKRDRKKNASPNAAQTESVCAGALDIQLSGDAYYFGELVKKDTIGDPIREIEPEDIARANDLLYLTSYILFVLGIVLLLVM